MFDPRSASRLIAISIAAVACALISPTRAADAPPSAHARDAQAHASSPVHADHLTPATDVLPLEGAARPCRTVFGFLPYWVSSSSVRWDLLTHVACFDVTINDLGQVTSSRSWPWTTTINTARSNGVKVLLTVTNFDPAQISSLLASPSAKQTLFNNLANLIRNNADGLVLDFEGTNTPAWQSQMPAFVSELRAALATRLAGSAYPSPLIYVATPAVNWAGSNGWNFAALVQQADGLFIMGYDFYGSWSSTSGPSAPLTGGSFNVTNTVVTQYAAARQTAAHKLFLGVPYYGHQWRTASNAPYSTAQSFVGSVIYQTAAAQVSTYGRLFDAASQTPYYAWNAAGQWNQVWFDDAQSLEAKFELARQNRLGGVGMWALAYDAGRTDLWSLIERRFVTRCACRSDFDLSATVETQDIFTFLNAWFAMDPAANVDSSPGLSISDVFTFLNLWFAGC